MNLLSKIGWGICFVLLLRLVFAERGMIDYYKMSDILKKQENKLNRTKKENEMLNLEIQRIEKDTSLQKKLVRDNLGFIANDEFLLLFAAENHLP